MIPPFLTALMYEGNLAGASAVVLSALNCEMSARGDSMSVETLMKIRQITDRNLHKKDPSVIVMHLP